MLRQGLVIVIVLGLLTIGVGKVTAQRQGFIAGFGVGPALQSRMSDNGAKGARFGLWTDLKIGSHIGHGWQVYFRQIAIPDTSGHQYPWITGLTSIAAGHEFPGTCASATGSVGVSVWGEFVDGFENGAVGPGVAAGLGCEVAPHIILDFDIVAARVYNSDDATLFIMKLGVSVLSY